MLVQEAISLKILVTNTQFLVAVIASWSQFWTLASNIIWWTLFLVQ